MILDYSKLPEWLQWVLLLAAVVVAFGVLWKLLKKLWPAFGRWVRAMSNFVLMVNTFTDPVVIKALGDLPQFMSTTARSLADQDATLTTHGEKLERIDHQIHENGGGSLKDAVVEVRNTLSANSERLERIEEGVAGLYDRVDDNEKAATQDRADIAAARKELEDTRPAPARRRTTKPRTIKPKE